MNMQMFIPFFSVLVIISLGVSQADISAISQKTDLKESSDTLLISGKKYSINDINSELISQMSYEQLLNLPFETLTKICKHLEISVDELLKTKTEVSSRAASTLREQPNILTVITEDQIKKSGFHDLMSVLEMVPGVFFGSDISGVTGIGMRGIWAQEGKVLLLIDGQEINEPRYAGVPFFNHFDIETIKRIEIIRGSGSSIWGGSAELGVINIITRKGSDINGIKISASGSYLQSTFGRENLSVSAGKNIRDFDFSISAHYGRAHRSENTFQPFYFVDGNSESGHINYPLSGDYGMSHSQNVNASCTWKNLSARFIYDFYKVYGIDEEIYDMSFKTFLGELKYDWNLIPGKLHIKPKYNFRYYIPWYTEGWYENQLIMRNRINISTLFEPHPILTTTGGVEFFNDQVSYENKEILFYNQKNKIQYNNEVIFLEGLLKLKPVKITVGGRLEHNDQYGFAFAPRAAINQVFGNFHYKLLFSKAFRAPGIGNLEMNPQIKPEETYVVELESGYKLHTNMFLKANFFDIRIRNPIYYLQTEDKYDYRNGDRMGTYGLECEYTIRHPRLNTSINYSYYRTHRGCFDNFLSSMLDNNSNLGAPAHKLSVFGSFNLTEKFSISSSVNIYSTTYGFTTIRAEPQNYENEVRIVPVEGKIEPSALFNAGFNLNNLIIHGLSISSGVTDIFNKKRPLLQPYNGFEAPMPGQGRSFYCKLNYSFKTFF